MADQNQESNPQPPKVKLNGNGKSETSAIPASNAQKSTTSRISLNTASMPTGGTPATSIKITPDNVKKATARLDLQEAIKKTTVRVQVEDVKKGDTQQLQAQRIQSAEAAKQKTSQINLNEVLGDTQDIFKRRTTLLDASKLMAGGASTSSAIPRTIRVKQPEVTPTAILKRPDDTSQVQPVMQASLEASKKSETARIELPTGVGAEEVPPTRRKTIRIKRPEGGDAPSRPMVIAASPAVGVTREQAVGEDSDEPGVVFVALAAVAALVVIGLISVQGVALNSFASF